LLFFNKNEIFVQREENIKSVNQIKIDNILEGRMIKHAQADPYNKSGFYIVIGNEFDLNLTIKHTNKQNFKIQIARDHETKELTIFDFFI